MALRLFIRRVSGMTKVKNGEVSAEAFALRPGEERLSYTGTTHRWSDVELGDYRAVYRLRSGDLPGAFQMGEDCFGDRLAQCMPYSDPDPGDADYGQAHCSGLEPATREDRSLLAERATRGLEAGLPWLPMVRLRAGGESS